MNPHIDYQKLLDMLNASSQQQVDVEPAYWDGEEKVIDFRIKYCLVQDDDGHWFIIPADKKQDWEDWLYKFYKEELENYDYPEWVQEIAGPHNVEFYLG